MEKYRFVQMDVFTNTAFAGNPLAVFPDAQGLSDERMMQIAREMNLSETVFVLPGSKDGPTDAQPHVLRHLRIFTPTREIPFAGHPVVGTWNALAREGVVPLPANGTGWTRIHHEVGIGILPVDIEFREGTPVKVVMTQGNFQVIDEIDDAHERAELARSLGRSVEDLDDSLPIQVITTGLSCLAVPMRSLASLRGCRINSSQLAEIYTSRGGTGCHVFTKETFEPTSRAHARFFAPADNIAEDPATGSACGALGAYLVHHGVLKQASDEAPVDFVIEQGDFMHRPSRVHLSVKGDSRQIKEVRVGGESVLVARGEVIF